MNNDNCLKNILKVIVTLQNNIEKLDNLNNSCTRPFLGLGNKIQPFNTRLVSFYKSNNTPITLPWNNGESSGTSSVFRVQRVCDNTCTVLILSDNGDNTWSSTNTYATLNLNCICAIQCLGDVTISNI